jgi:RimJ/RimL family protein N-acetyltransferase
MMPSREHDKASPFGPPDCIGGVRLRLMTATDRDALLAGSALPDAVTVPDYPTEFSRGMAPMVGAGSPLGPFLILRADDSIVVGDIGGGYTAPGQVEIGYAIAPSCRGRRFATDAVKALVDRARHDPAIHIMVGHTPLDRPASGRVLEHVGFALVGEVNDEHDGTPLRVREWRLDVKI